MPLQDLNDLLRGATGDAIDQRRLRSYFANMLNGLAARHVTSKACHSRLSATLARLQRINASSWSTFHSELDHVLVRFEEQDHYQRPQPLDLETERLGVTFQKGDPAAIAAWLGASAEPREVTRAVAQGTTKQGATVGPPGKALWLTPYVGEVEEILLSARRSHSTDLANRARALIGASHWNLPSDVFAFVTRRPICDLLFTADGDSHPQQRKPVGSTVIEARTHNHFRTWPRPGSAPDAYGRSYHLDAHVRQSTIPSGTFGVREATRSPLPLIDFSECVYIGRTDAQRRLDEPSNDYLHDIGASGAVHELLADLIQRVAVEGATDRG